MTYSQRMKRRVEESNTVAGLAAVLAAGGVIYAVIREAILWALG